MQRDDEVRQLWLDGFEFAEDLPRAQVFVRGQERVLVLKRETATPIPIVVVPDAPGQFLSPCCRAPSRLRRVINGMIYFRCTACTYLWDRPAGRTRTLAVVK